MNSPDLREEVQELTRLGYSIRSIAQRLGIPSRLVRRALRAEDVSTEDDAEEMGLAPRRMEVRRACEEAPQHGPVKVLMRNGKRVEEVIEV